MNQSKMPLYERLLSRTGERPISFHVPGHKNGALYASEIGSAFRRIAGIDMTELTGLDDLHSPEGVIQEAEELLSDLYESEKSYFLVNGSTSGNMAMIMSSCSEGDTVLVQRNCHKSVLNGIMLAKAEPVFISPEIDSITGLPGKVDQEEVKKAFESFPAITACIFTYPDYYGHTYDLRSIIKTAHQFGAAVLIDEAHGPHFMLGEPFPASAVSLGADVVVQSAHKMLPAMTMGSYLHLNSSRVSKEKLEWYLSIFQSSSPSYPIMASLDFARSYLAGFNQEDIAYTLEEGSRFIASLESIPSLTVQSGDDPLKITLRHENYSGVDLQKKLEEAGIYPELADPNAVLLVLPLLKKGMAFPYKDAVTRMKKIEWTRKEAYTEKRASNIQLSGISKISAAAFQNRYSILSEWVYIKEGEGRVAAEMVIPYPPGIPLLMPGETITGWHISRLEELLVAGVRFQGAEHLKDGKIAVYIQSPAEKSSGE